MKKALAALFISLGVLIPAFAFASNNSRDNNNNEQQSLTQETSGERARLAIVYLHIASSGSDRSIALPGDTVSLAFTTSAKVRNPVVFFNAKSMRPVFTRATNSSGNNWIAAYTVSAKDPLGKVTWAIALVDEEDDYEHFCASFSIPGVSYCPAADDSSVTITKPLPPDVVPPVITSVPAPVVAEATSPTGAAVTYALPIATDDRDGVVPVSCTPAPGSTFALGTTTVTCSARDAAGNAATSSFTVTVRDTTPPVIAAHADVFATTTATSAAVSYSLPTANDLVSGAVAVLCAPAPGSTFALGTTTVTCSAHDAAGNAATSTFSVGLVRVALLPEPFVMASQPNESYLCTPNWHNCYTASTSVQKVIKLGAGAGLGQGTILSVTTTRKDDYTPDNSLVSNPWILSLACYTDAAYTTTCPDWVAPNSFNGQRTWLMSEFAASSTDKIHWNAYFTDPSHERGFDGSSPVRFNPARYYQLIINDNGWELASYGSATDPYWVLTGMTQ